MCVSFISWKRHCLYQVIKLAMKLDELFLGTTFCWVEIVTAEEEEWEVLNFIHSEGLSMDMDKVELTGFRLNEVFY